MYKLIAISIIVIFMIVNCTREEAPAPLPPPVKQVSAPPSDGDATRFVIGNELVKKQAFVNPNDPPKIGEDCNSICNRVIECVKDYSASKLFKSVEQCIQKCNNMTDLMKSAIAKAKDCAYVRCNINRYVCDMICNEAAKCNNGNIPQHMGSNMANCLKGCMDVFGMNDKVSTILGCIANSSGCLDVSKCNVGDISPAKSVQDYCQ